MIIKRGVLTILDRHTLTVLSKPAVAIYPVTLCGLAKDGRGAEDGRKSTDVTGPWCARGIRSRSLVDLRSKLQDC